MVVARDGGDCGILAFLSFPFSYLLPFSLHDTLFAIRPGEQQIRGYLDNILHCFMYHVFFLVVTYIYWYSGGPY